MPNGVTNLAVSEGRITDVPKGSKCKNYSRGDPHLAFKRFDRAAVSILKMTSLGKEYLSIVSDRPDPP